MMATSMMTGGAVPGSLVCDGQPDCVRGMFVRVSSEYVEWDVFKKFKGKVGMLTWRHFSGMWYADFPGEDEYGFLCGPLLFQLQYSSEQEAKESALLLENIRKEREMKSALDSEKSKQLVLALEKRAQEMSATTIKLFEQMAIIQEEMRKAEIDMNIMDTAFTELTAHANSLDAELSTVKTERNNLLSSNSELQIQLTESEADVKRFTARVKEIAGENIKYKEDLAESISTNAALAHDFQENKLRAEQLELEKFSLQEQVNKYVDEQSATKAQLAIMEENFLKARQEASDSLEEAAKARSELQEIEGRESCPHNFVSLTFSTKSTFT